MMIPHPPIFLSDIRLADIVLLLVIGATWEVLQRSLLLVLCRIKPGRVALAEAQLAVLQQETNLKRNMGPSAFVETSKLERQCLQMERELTALHASRQQRTEYWERLLLRYGNLAVAATIFVAYYGVPVLTLEGLDSVLLPNDEIVYSAGSFIDGAAYLKALLFPIAYIGLGMKISKWGMAAESLGALAVFWSAQVTTSQVMDGVDAYVMSSSG